MTGCIVKVWFEADSEVRAKAPRFTVVETELPDFATFCEMVEADRLIGGAILWTQRNDFGEQVIKDRRPTAFRGQTVLRCELPSWRYVESG